MSASKVARLTWKIAALISWSRIGRNGSALRDCHFGRIALESTKRPAHWSVTTWQSAGRLTSRPGLARRDRIRIAGQDAVELAAGADAELGEDLARVVVDGAGADEQAGADLGIGQAVSVPPARVHSASRSRASLAMRVLPVRTAASISSGSTHTKT